MNLWKKIILWSLISLMIQLAVLWFIDDIYLENRGKIIETTLYNVNGIGHVPEVLRISENTSNVRVSSDCNFAAYLYDGDLKVVDLGEKNKKKIISKGKKQIEYFKWLPDRDMIIYAYSEKKNEKYLINIETYDAKSGIIREYPVIEADDIDGDAEVYSIEVSSLVNTVYVLLKSDDRKIRIYKYDIVENLSYIATMEHMYPVHHLVYTDGLIFQNYGDGIFIFDRNKKLMEMNYNSSGRKHLLGTDGSGMIYIAVTDDSQNVKEINIGSIKDFNGNEFKRIRIKDVLLPGNIVVTLEGDLFAILEKENKVSNIPTNAGTIYPGKFIQVAGSYIISKENNNFRFTKLNVLH